MQTLLRFVRVPDRPLLWAVLGLIFTVPPMGASPNIEGVIALPGGHLEIVFSETESIPAEHVLRGAETLPGDTWGTLFALAEPLGDSRFRVTTDLDGADRFFRICGNYINVGDDQDDDGLSDWQESQFGTRIDFPDTDDDGFSDALEIGARTNPREATDHPALLAQPAVRFAKAMLETSEVDGPIRINLELSRPFSGIVHYAIAAISNTLTEGEDADFAPISGEVEVHGWSAELVLTCLDDARIESAEILVLDLLDDIGGRYHVGSIPRLTLILYDNDAYWNGVLSRDQTALDFRLRIVESGGTLTAALVSSLDPTRSGGAPGIGTIPVGEWPVTITREADSFYAVSDPILSSTHLMFQSDLARQLIFEATPPGDPDTPNVPFHLTEHIIVGQYIDTLTPQNPDLKYLERKSEGTFILLKDLPLMEEITIPTWQDEGSQKEVMP